MRIAYLVNRYPAVSHSFIRREIQALERTGVEVLRISVRKPGPVPDASDQEESDKTVVLLGSAALLIRDAVVCLAFHPLSFCRLFLEVLSLSRKADRGLLAHGAYLLEACRLARLMKSRGFTHVHAHFGTNPAAVALLSHRLSGVTYSFTVHGPEEFDRPDAIKLTRKIEAAEFVVAISSYGRSQLMRWCSREHWGKIHVVRCGVDQSFIGNVGDVEYDEKCIVCVGRLCEQKGQLLLIDAMARLRDRGFTPKLVLAGDGDMRALIEKRIEQLGLQSQVAITGWLSGIEVKEWLLRCKAMVLPSFAEGLPVVIMEAFALGRPVITTYIAGIPELVENDINGWMVPAGSVHSLAEAIRSACDANLDEVSRLGEAGRQRVRKLHDSDREARRLCDLYISVLRTRKNYSSRALAGNFGRQPDVSDRSCHKMSL